MKMNAKSFHDEVGWSRVLERRPPDRKTSMQWEKITKLQCQKKCATVARLFQKKIIKNNTEFLGAETAKKGVQSTLDCTPFCQEKKRKNEKN